MPASGYALDEVTSPVTASPRRLSTSGSAYTTMDRGGVPATAPATRHLNAAALFQRLGLAGRTGSPGSPQPEAETPPTSSDGLQMHMQLRDNDITPMPLSSSEVASSYMTASSSSGSIAEANRNAAAQPNGAHASSKSSANASSAAASSSARPPTMTPIDADILLPFADRPSEVKELLEENEKNRGLYELLKDTFTPKRVTSPAPLSSSPAAAPSSLAGPQRSLLSQNLNGSGHARNDSGSTITPTSKWTWDDLQAHLSIPREQLGDQDWIDVLKAHVYTRSQLLWERLRACLGVDVDDERGGDRYEPLSSDIVYEDAEAAYKPSPGTGAIPVSPLQRNLADLYTATQEYTNPFSPQRGPANLTVPPSPSSMNPLSPINLRSPSLAGPAPVPLAVAPAAAAPVGVPTAAQPMDIASSSPRSSGRVHRRTSSGGSSFRRSFQMSSISEDAPLDKFDDLPSNVSSGRHTPVLATPELEHDELPAPGSQGSSTGSSPASQGATQDSPSHPPTNAGRVDVGSLYRLKGLNIGDPTSAANILSGSALSVSSGPGTPSSFASGFASYRGPGHLPPPTPISPGMPSPSAAFGSLGLHLAQPAPASSAIQAAQQTRQAGYDDYASVFGSEESSSVLGDGGVKSMGRGPGMRFSFGAADSARPAAGAAQGPAKSGFALAGMSLAPAKKSSANSSMHDLDSGKSTPKAMSPLPGWSQEAFDVQA